MSSKPLTIYKASAGSGKTFTLATEYIKLLIQNPQSYRNILAVTFTNKATEEMKMRILSQLYGISCGLADSSMYMDKICAELDASPAFVSRQAGIALRLLMHNYNYFKVETIDAFFQKVLRNLARELDLTANLRIELNDTQIEEQAVDTLIQELDSQNEVLRWILSYVNDKISDDKSWNVIGQIKSFGQTIFKDFYKEKSDMIDAVLSDRNFLDRYIKRLRREADEAKERMAGFATAFFDTIAAEGLEIGDFSNGKSGVCGFFLKLQNGIFDESIVGKRVADCLESADKWVTKTNPRRDEIKAVAETRLIPILRLACDERPDRWRCYKSVDVTLRHLNQLRLLGSIEGKVRELNDESNRFLLSDTQQLLHSLIHENDSPFVFEKIGAQLKHVMIDEFQDTSSIQWQNFKILLNECMSHTDTGNLIVGDVKQSIYRWRSGDWRLLNNIRSEFSMPDSQLDIRTLTYNYRSCHNIIRFNNAFFTRATEIEHANFAEISEDYAVQIKNAYSDVCQNYVSKTETGPEGLVSVELLPKEDYIETTLSRLVDIVADLSGRGVAPGSMAILVRNNDKIPLIAQYFAEQLPQVQIISDEAFRLDASLAVNILINALNLLVCRTDLLVMATLAKDYRRVISAETADDRIFLSVDDIMSLLPRDYAENMDRLAVMPLYELTEKLYSVFQLNRIEGQSAYISTFYDNMLSFIQDNSADIAGFVEEWKSRLYSKTIQSDQIDGIRLISIHKSKGLEFDNVIIPFCDWVLEKTNGNIIWCSPQQKPYSELPLVPVDYSRKGMVGTIYENDYFDEYLQNCVDNLNLLYVAFTRAGHNLFVIGRRDASGSRSLLIQDSLPALTERLGDVEFNEGEDKGQPVVFSYGQLRVDRKTKSDVRSANVFIQPVTNLDVSIETFSSKVGFKQSNKSREFTMSDNDIDAERQEYINTGSILHNIFSSIRTASDIDGVLKQFEIDGIVSDPERIGGMLRKRLADPRVAEWFSDRWELYNECSILTVDAASGEVITRRPDRVMTDGERMIVVDFKFGCPRDEYYAQVREYMSLLAGMGYQDIKGYLWFVYSNKIEEVE